MFMADHVLTQYLSLVDQVDALWEAVNRPLPVCIWANPLKTRSDWVQAELRAKDIPLEPVDWYEGAFRTAFWRKPGDTLPFIAGWYVVQEEIAMTAVCALDPQPGERILDLCAAPGNKTAQIATRLMGWGMVVANEWNTGRLASLTSAIARLGLLNVAVTHGDGRYIPLLSYSFDRVLVDVPCSGDGTLRKHPNRNWSVERSRRSRDRLIPIQIGLLDRALQLVKPGGVVVYSTCTFAPEENEAVLDAVLGDRGHLEPISIPLLRFMPGLTHWQGRTFRSDLNHAHRYFPHFNDTGGFFVARIRRSEAQLDATELDSIHESSSTAFTERPQEWQDFCDRFGVTPEAVSSLCLWEKGRDKLWLAESDCQPPPQIEVQNLGIPLFRHVKGRLKPTTAGLQRLGRLITCNAVELSQPEQISAFLTGQSQRIQADVEDGYVHVRASPFELGCGLYHSGTLHSHLPKALRLTSGAWGKGDRPSLRL